MIEKGEKTNQYWDIWDSWHKYPTEIVKDYCERIYKFLKYNHIEDLKLLDLGTGSGIISELTYTILKEKLNNVVFVGIEIFDNDNLKNQIIKNFKGNINFIDKEENSNNDTYNLIFDDFIKFEFEKKYSCLLLIDFLHYIKKNDINSFINKCLKLVNDNGLIFIAIPSGDVKLLVGDKNVGENNSNYKSYQKLWDTIRSAMEPNNEYYLPTDYESLIKPFLDLKDFVKVMEFSYSWKKEVGVDQINDLYNIGATSYYRLNDKKKTINFNFINNRNIELFFSEKCLLLIKNS